MSQKNKRVSVGAALRNATTPPTAPSRDAAETTNEPKALVVYLSAAAGKQLAHLAVDTGKTKSAIVREALNKVFLEHGKLEIAD